MPNQSFSHHSFVLVWICCLIGIQQSWTSCVLSTPVWWKSWQKTTASCSRRSTRGSHWRSATSRTCPSWRYANPDAQCVYLACASVSPGRDKNELSCTKPGQCCTASNLVSGCGSSIIGGNGRSLRWKFWGGVWEIELGLGGLCWLWKLECLRLCAVYKQHFPARHPDQPFLSFLRVSWQVFFIAQTRKLYKMFCNLNYPLT